MPVNIFFCYAHEDEALVKKLKTHLSPLQRQGLIDIWHDRDISGGMEWEREISQHLNTAQFILLLVSPDFMASDYCYGIEMKQAMKRHEQAEACVIPVILRPVIWKSAPFGKLQALPTDAKPVTDPAWHDVDEALSNVAEYIYKVVKQPTMPSTDLTEKRDEFANKVFANITLFEEHNDKSGNEQLSNDHYASEDRTLTYSFDHIGGKIWIKPQMPYLTLLAGGGPIVGHYIWYTPFNWHFPRLSVKVVNNSKHTLLLSEAVIQVNAAFLIGAKIRRRRSSHKKEYRDAQACQSASDARSAGGAQGA